MLLTCTCGHAIDNHAMRSGRCKECSCRAHMAPDDGTLPPFSVTACARTDPQRAAAAALDAAADHVGPARTLVLVTSLKDPYGVELGSDVPPTHAFGMLEMALLKLRRAHRL